MRRVTSMPALLKQIIKGFEQVCAWGENWPLDLLLVELNTEKGLAARPTLALTLFAAPPATFPTSY